MSWLFLLSICPHLKDSESPAPYGVLVCGGQISCRERKESGFFRLASQELFGGGSFPQMVRIETTAIVATVTRKITGFDRPSQFVFQYKSVSVETFCFTLNFSTLNDGVTITSFSQGTNHPAARLYLDPNTGNYFFASQLFLRGRRRGTSYIFNTSFFKPVLRIFQPRT